MRFKSQIVKKINELKKKTPFQLTISHITNKSIVGFNLNQGFLAVKQDC